MNLVKEIPLPNGLVMQVWDRSRPISSDTAKVELYIMIPVTVRKGYFSNSEEFQRVVEVFGPKITYEYTKERTFINTPDRGEVFDELLEDFRRDSLPYLSRADFPARFALSKLREILRCPYKYRIVRWKANPGPY